MLHIGLDIGHSAVKVSASNRSGKIEKIVFPTLVTPAFRLLDEHTAALARVDTVRFEGREWFTGKTAEEQGKLSAYTGQDRNWVMSKTHDILLLSALDRTVAKFGERLDGSVIALGLPAAYYSTQRASLRTRVISVLASAYGQAVADSVRIRILPQPYGPLNVVALNEDGAPPTDRDLDSEAWGVVEIGHFTTDFILVSSGRVIEHASGSSEGLRGVYERMTTEFIEKDYPTAPGDLTEALITKHIRYFGHRVDVSEIVNRAVDAVGTEIVSETQRLFGPFASKLNGVLVAGGGAGVIAPKIHAVYPHTMLLDSPRFAVAEGFRRHSVFVSLPTAAEV